jgi:hypothetical protein
MAADTSALDVFRAYNESFRSLDPRAVARFYNEPSLLIAPTGTFVLSTGAEVERVYDRVMTDARAQGYATTEWATLEERRLDPETSAVTGSGVWKDAKGNVFSRFGATYILRRPRGAPWRIVTGIITDRS